jgi:hypothetical protein
MMGFDMNPYAKFVDGQNPIEVITATNGKLEKLFDTLGPVRSDKKPAPGKWSAREILCHLADCEVVFAFRLRQALAENRHVIQPFDQDNWAKSYTHYRVPDALAVFSSVRAWNLAFIQAAPPEALAKQLNHPERGDMSFQVLVETIAGHDLNHLPQIERIAAAA